MLNIEEKGGGDLLGELKKIPEAKEKSLTPEKKERVIWLKLNLNF